MVHKINKFMTDDECPKSYRVLEWNDETGLPRINYVERAVFDFNYIDIQYLTLVHRRSLSREPWLATFKATMVGFNGIILDKDRGTTMCFNDVNSISNYFNIDIDDLHKENKGNFDVQYTLPDLDRFVKRLIVDKHYLSRYFEKKARARKQIEKEAYYGWDNT